MTVWAPCSDVIYHIWSHTGMCSSFHRTAQSEEWRQISPHDQRQGADAPCTSHEAQTQFRERTDTWREVMDRVPSDRIIRIIRTEENLVKKKFFFNFLFQKRESPQQEPGQQCPQIIWVQYSRKPHIHMEPNGQPHSADPQPSVLHPSHGRASGPNQETTPRTRENWEPKQNHNSQTNTGDYHYC